MTCFCGCGDPPVAEHHVIYRQELRHHQGRASGNGALVADRRNLVPVAFRCHQRHHAQFRPYALGLLPDSVFEFAREVLGGGHGYEYLRRRYAGADPRLDALLEPAGVCVCGHERDQHNAFGCIVVEVVDELHVHRSAVDPFSEREEPCGCERFVAAGGA